MTSHEYAKMLREAAESLETRTEFDLPRYISGDSEEAKYRVNNFSYYSDKDAFLAAVKALGPGMKSQGEKFREEELVFIIPNGRISVSVNRDRVCRLVKPAQPAKYKCEPLLSQVEAEQLELQQT